MIEKETPHVLIGATGKRGIFDEQILKNLNKDESFQPIIFALSNPTSKAECTFAQSQRFSNDRAIFVSGSPF